MSYHADKLGEGWTDGRTDTGNDNTWRPKLASGKKLLEYLLYIYTLYLHWTHHIAFCSEASDSQPHQFKTVQM